LRLRQFYSGKRVLITGHTGFKGSWLAQWLIEMGAEVCGYALEPPSEPSHFSVLRLASRLRDVRGDIRDRDALRTVVRSFRPQVVFHLAAQSLVPAALRAPAETFEVNTIGTVNVLDTLRDHEDLNAAVICTSDKCYQNTGAVWGFREIDPLGGDDPYSASKACAEIAYHGFANTYPQLRRVSATTRAGNVIGGGDWAADRIVPEAVRAWATGQPILVRNPSATRPWQHVLEPLSGYLWLAARIAERTIDGGEAFNFGPPPSFDPSVRHLLDQMLSHWEGARWIAAANPGAPEIMSLRLCSDKAWARIGWRPTLSFEEATQATIAWYRTYYEQSPAAAAELTSKQIASFVHRARDRGLSWASCGADREP